MGLKWKIIEADVIEICRHKRKGIKLKFKESCGCSGCALTESNLCKKFNICYWISNNKQVKFDRVYKNGNR
jgi:hypothetical protein